MTVFYAHLENSPGRYTKELRLWTLRKLAGLGIQVHEIEGTALHADGVIRQGVVLDQTGRPYYSLGQISEVIRLIDRCEITCSDILLFDDFMTPGFDALAYVLMQRPKADRPRIYLRLHAQSVDAYDFTFPMRHALRPTELMVDSFANGIFVSSGELKQLLQVGLFQAPIHVTGHIFDRDWVRARVPDIKPLAARSKRIAWSSRWDVEKDPGFFMDLIDEGSLLAAGYKFVALSGHPEFRSNSVALRDRALAMHGKLEIRAGLSKDEYYRIIADSRLHFMASKQDWISYVLLEASALGTPTLAPCFRSFPEALNYNHHQLYVPTNLQDALTKAGNLLARPPNDAVVGFAADHHHQSLQRMLDAIGI